MKKKKSTKKQKQTKRKYTKKRDAKKYLKPKGLKKSKPLPKRDKSGRFKKRSLTDDERTLAHYTNTPDVRSYHYGDLTIFSRLGKTSFTKASKSDIPVYARYYFSDRGQIKSREIRLIDFDEDNYDNWIDWLQDFIIDINDFITESAEKRGDKPKIVPLGVYVFFASQKPKQRKRRK